MPQFFIWLYYASSMHLWCWTHLPTAYFVSLFLPCQKTKECRWCFISYEHCSALPQIDVHSMICVVRDEVTLPKPPQFPGYGDLELLAAQLTSDPYRAKWPLITSQVAFEDSRQDFSHGICKSHFHHPISLCLSPSSMPITFIDIMYQVWVRNDLWGLAANYTSCIMYALPFCIILQSLWMAIPGQ